MSKKKKQYNSFEEVFYEIQKTLTSKDDQEFDKYSIEGQLTYMTHCHRIYKLVNWVQEQKQTCLKNFHLQLLINEGHLHAQCVYVRGLATGNQDNEISFPSLIKLYREHCELFTRKHFVEWNGIPYEYKDKEIQATLELNSRLKKDNIVSVPTENWGK